MSLVKPVTRKPANWAKMGMYDRENYLMEDELRQKPDVEIKNLGMVFGVLSLGLAAAFGVAGIAATRSVGRGLAAALAGAVAGVVAVALAGIGVVPYFYRNAGAEMALSVPLFTHAALFAAVGLAAGLSVGLVHPSRGAILRGLLGGVVGGVLGAVMFDLVMALVFSDTRVLDPLPKEAGDRIPRLAAHLCAGLCAAFFAVSTAIPRTPSVKAVDVVEAG